MADLVRAEYRTCRTIYVSWDAASWHISKKLFSHLSEINQQSSPRRFPYSEDCATVVRKDGSVELIGRSEWADWSSRACY
ncbi:MAG TPA: hypothetical protein VK638_29065 [Edaphobacter sp.]|nr:hypothetical protein [Edaphobacter sp.]